jgi:dTDP-4-amino-4,6-dideoxygalactose transaminase
MEPEIPFNKPARLGAELPRLQTALEGQTSGGGPFGKRCEEKLREMLGCPALLVTSATHALEMCALLLEVGPGDEVILPSFTFVSCANAFLLRGAKIVFADCDLSGNIDPAEVARLLTPRTRAVMPMDYAGYCCDLKALREAAGKAALVEDAAQAIGASFEGRPLGTFGSCAAISFHETKNISCGEGGALVLRDAALVERAEILRDKGTNRRRFLEGLVDKYTWVDLGSSYALSDLNAAWLSLQLEESARIQARRLQLLERYFAELSEPFDRAGASLVRGRPGCSGNGHLFAAVFRAPEERTRFIAQMRAQGIATPFHYVALHTSAMGRKIHGGRSLPISERLSLCLVRLPLYFNLTDAEQERVISAARQFLRTC